MSIISQKIEENQECNNRISNFFSQYNIGKLLLKCGAGKEKGICIVAIFKYSNFPHPSQAKNIEIKPKYSV